MSDGVTKRYPHFRGGSETRHPLPSHTSGFFRFVEAYTGLRAALNSAFSPAGGVIQTATEDAFERPFSCVETGGNLVFILVFVWCLFKCKRVFAYGRKSSQYVRIRVLKSFVFTYKILTILFRKTLRLQRPCVRIAPGVPLITVCSVGMGGFSLLFSTAAFTE